MVTLCWCNYPLLSASDDPSGQFYCPLRRISHCFVFRKIILLPLPLSTTSGAREIYYSHGYSHQPLLPPLLISQSHPSAAILISQSHPSATILISQSHPSAAILISHSFHLFSSVSHVLPQLFSSASHILPQLFSSANHILPQLFSSANYILPQLISSPNHILTQLLSFTNNILSQQFLSYQKYFLFLLILSTSLSCFSNFLLILLVVDYLTPESSTDRD
jgi:hypothetical protein